MLAKAQCEARCGMNRTFRDYLALEVAPDGTQMVLGAFHVRVGKAFDYAVQHWKEPFEDGRGRIIVDERPGTRHVVGSARG